MFTYFPEASKFLETNLFDHLSLKSSETPSCTGEKTICACEWNTMPRNKKVFYILLFPNIQLFRVIYAFSANIS